MAVRQHFWKGLIALIALNALLYGRQEILSKEAYKAAFKGDGFKKRTIAMREALKKGRPKGPAATPSEIAGIHPRGLVA